MTPQPAERRRATRGSTISAIRWDSKFAPRWFAVFSGVFCPRVGSRSRMHGSRGPARRVVLHGPIDRRSAHFSERFHDLRARRCSEARGACARGARLRAPCALGPPLDSGRNLERARAWTVEDASRATLRVIAGKSHRLSTAVVLVEHGGRCGGGGADGGPADSKRRARRILSDGISGKPPAEAVLRRGVPVSLARSAAARGRDFQRGGYRRRRLADQRALRAPGTLGYPRLLRARRCRRDPNAPAFELGLHLLARASGSSAPFRVTRDVVAYASAPSKPLTASAVRLDVHHHVAHASMVQRSTRDGKAGPLRSEQKRGGSVTVRLAAR